MSGAHRNVWFLRSLLLALLLLAAQAASLAHAYEHESGTPQARACAACVTASQLAHACAGSFVVTGLVRPLPTRCCGSSGHPDPAHLVIARQRAPPVSALS